MRSKFFTCASVCVLLAACGGGGGVSSGGSSSSSSTAATVDAGNTSQATTGQTPALMSNANPLNLSPAPQFTPSTRQVKYDDCFPAYTDMVAGDQSSSRNETAMNGTINAYTNTTSILSVTPTTFNGRQAVSIDSDTAPTTITSGSTVISTVSGTRMTSIAMQGNSFTQLSKTYFTPGVYDTTTTYTPTQLGDLSVGHMVTSFTLGDSMTDAMNTSSTYAGGTTNSNFSVQVKFIGVDEGTTVIGGAFPYTCVFRYTFFNASSLAYAYADTYIHKWGVAKTISYSNSYPRPLVSQMVSDTGYNRRKAAGL